MDSFIPPQPMRTETLVRVLRMYDGFTREELDREIQTLERSLVRRASKEELVKMRNRLHEIGKEKKALEEEANEILKELSEALRHNP